MLPSGKYKPARASYLRQRDGADRDVRSFADVVLPETPPIVTVPAISTGSGRSSPEAVAAFKRYQTRLGDDQGDRGTRQRAETATTSSCRSSRWRHAAIDLRLVDPDNDNEAGQQVNQLVGKPRIWSDTASAPMSLRWQTVRSAGRADDFSDLGTISVEKSAASRPTAGSASSSSHGRTGVRNAFMQDFKKSEAKQRLFGEVRAARSASIGSSDTMGTGVNEQLR